MSERGTRSKWRMVPEDREVANTDGPPRVVLTKKYNGLFYGGLEISINQGGRYTGVGVDSASVAVKKAEGEAIIMYRNFSDILNGGLD